MYFSHSFSGLHCGQLYEELLANGGFTIDPVSLNFPTRGFAVGRHGFEQKTRWHGVGNWRQKQIVARVIGNYANKHGNELSQASAHLGGWIYDGWLYLDVSDVVKTRWSATILAHSRDQLAFYDIAAGTEIPCETGVAGEDEIEHARRQIG